MDWKKEIAISHLIKQGIAEIDVNGLWLNTLPEVAASDEQLRNLEAYLGYELNYQYRSFLSYANGWRAFSGYIDIFGVDDFFGRATSSSCD
ncbi:SMI1/KNR4 family protein [Lampropedia aestuarii]|uniref:SMI1/KNR4 family protein n=1 Tax=Lampropedia aestuarii TaxID=2562762 RepID=A0A4S5BJK6_9BURK|nr:SMI1/KNR4 family protein [Lampropedia aestuarii]THJ31015.1 SMI1/KNR4 family protein [Lampropedia aestuarii]